MPIGSVMDGMTFGQPVSALRLPSRKPVYLKTPRIISTSATPTIIQSFFCDFP